MEEENEQKQLNAFKASKIARKIVEDNFGNLAFLQFRVHSIKPNTDKDKWVVKTSIIPNVSEKKRMFHKIKVNIVSGVMEDLTEITEENLSTEE